MTKLGYDLLNNVATTTFLEISCEWLLANKGVMMKEDIFTLNEPIAPYGKSIQKILRDKDLQIEELRELVKLQGGKS